MSEADLIERPWFVFSLSASATAYVPAPTEEQARRQMIASSYKDAPVHEWPCIGSRFTSRESLSRSLLRKRLITMCCVTCGTSPAPFAFMGGNFCNRCAP